MKLLTTFALVAFAACTSDDRVSNPTSFALTDACTGEVIGVKDVSTGEYRFDDGVTIDETQIAPVSHDLGACDDIASANRKFCWVMIEGPDLGCTGCCTDHGGGTYTCSEYCWDVSST